MKHTTTTQRKWTRCKTGLMVFGMMPSAKIKNHFTAVSEHGQRIHFPASFIHRDATHDEVAAAEVSYAPHLLHWQKKEEKKIKQGIGQLKQKFGFHVI